MGAGPFVWHHKVTAGFAALGEKDTSGCDHDCLKERKVERDLKSAKIPFVFCIETKKMYPFPNPRVSMTHVDDFLAHVSRKQQILSAPVQVVRAGPAV